jgi:hypothetical protein
MNNIYIARTYGVDTSYIKLGYSNDVFKRLDAYYAHNPLIEIVGTAYVEDALLFEQDLHSKIDSVIRKEWYTEDKLPIILTMIEEVGGVFEEGAPIKVKTEKEKSLTYYDYAVKLKDLNKEEAMELVKTIKNKTWHPLFYYGIETNKILVSYTEAKIYYESGDWIEQVKNTITEHFQVNKFYTSAYIKTTLQKIYKDIGINKTAKATDLYELFAVRAERQTIKGATTRGFIIEQKTQRIAGIVTKGFTVLPESTKESAYNKL